MAMDEDEFVERYVQEQKNNRKAETDHAAARFAREPERALKAMQEEFSDYAFAPVEVEAYIANLSGHGRDNIEGAPALETLASHQEMVIPRLKAELEGAADGEEYAELSVDRGSVFAYIGDKDLDI